MGVEGEEPTVVEVAEVRAAVTRRVEEGAGDVDQEMLARVATDAAFLGQFWLHVFELPGPQVEEAATMIVNTARWRSEFGAAEVGEGDFTQTMLDKGSLFSRNRDKDGKKLLVFNVGKHVKGAERMEDMKRFFVYQLERLGREETLCHFSIVFDCRGAGLKNMDMEFTQFMINTMRDFYPNPLNYILVFEMPWVLNAAFKIIKAWLPPAAVKKIKFLTKSNMGEYVDEENRLEAWGGADSWEYKFEPESRLTNGSKEEGRKKTVTFAGAPLVTSPSADSLGSALSGGSGAPAGPQGTDLLHLAPAQEVVFSASPLGDLTGRVALTNTSGKPLGYKIKTTSPEKYRVRPSTGCLGPGAAVTVEIHVSGQARDTATLGRDKFLVTAVLLEKEDTPPAALAEALRTTTPDGQYRLRCQLAGAPEHHAPAPHLSSPPAPPVPEDPARQLASIGRRVGQLVEGQEQLAGQLRQLHLLLMLVIVLLAASLLLLLFRLPYATNSAIQVEDQSLPDLTGTVNKTEL